MVVGGWIGYLIGLIVSLVVAWVISPLFPSPVSVIVFWVAIIAALVCLIYLALALWHRMHQPGPPP